jgi:hypothetical protein
MAGALKAGFWPVSGAVAKCLVGVVC